MSSVPKSENLVTVSFKLIGQDYVNFKIRLKTDGFDRTDFFKSLIKGYSDKDERIIEYLDENALKNKKTSKTKLKQKEVVKKKENKIKEQFALDDKEVESIFDLIAEEHPEL